eukprot:TRINITY_DN4572_c0_g1_i6.p1 TRINITY_DN4572_c0_g1~~TRINITY_DN4572_c0_g1_i6.p1  ORF type:complete len:134 (-),score=15.24 TRINITY_DN4572_c0_g1_i6:138-539(-)
MEIFAAGLRDGTIQILNAIDGKTHATLSGHTDLVRSVAFSNDGALLASVADDYTSRIYDAVNMIPLHVFQSGTRVVSFSGSSVVIAQEDRLEVYATGRTAVKILEHQCGTTVSLLSLVSSIGVEQLAETWFSL